jgi:hypothetical protein
MRSKGEAFVPVKRLNYFTHQFLREQDFKDEQAYHLEMRRRHNRCLHAWGVVEGLEVHKKGEREIVVDSGMAIDGQGREIILALPATRNLGHFGRDTHVYITIAYHENWEDADHTSAGGVRAYTRITESQQIEEQKQQPARDGAVITLARVHLNDLGHVHRIDMDSSVRKSAVGAGGEAGWMRLVFKPVRLSPVKIEEKRVKILSEKEAEEYEFIVDEASAYCDAHGALGSMAIPVPPGVRRIVGFKIAGTTQGNVSFNLFRTGWNLEENIGEKTELLKEAFGGPWFHKELNVHEGRLDDTHALAVSVKAEGETNIYLVAAKFE